MIHFRSLVMPVTSFHAFLSTEHSLNKMAPSFAWSNWTISSKL